MSRMSPRPGQRERERATQDAARKKVLFICIGNMCRSPMAEALANAYGGDVLRAQSAGVNPGFMPARNTRTVLAEKNIDLGDHIPKAVESVDLDRFDLVVNMSGYPIPATKTKVEVWEVEDPIGQSEEAYRRVRDHLELRVMNLVLRARTGKI